MNTRSDRGAIPVIYVIVAGALAIGAFLFRPRALHGDSRRADASTTATQQVEKANTAAEDALKKKSATAAASVAKIGEVNANAPASRQKDFIAQEVPVALANLEQPDPQAMFAAEQRKVAVLEGRVEEANHLYAQAMQRADQLEKDRADAIAAREKAIEARRAVDQELQRVAAERLASEHERNMWILSAVLVGVLYLYVKLTHFSPAQIANTVHDIRVGKIDPIQALDGPASRLQQWIVSHLAHLKSKP